MVSAEAEDMVQDQADDEEELSSTISGKPHVSLLNSYQLILKDERRPACSQRADKSETGSPEDKWMDGLVIYQLSADMEEVVEMENDLTYMLEDCALKLEDSPSNIY